MRAIFVFFGGQRQWARLALALAQGAPVPLLDEPTTFLDPAHAIDMLSLAREQARGGKAANIVFDDAPIEQAIEGIVNGIFFNQGHVCCAGSRLLVQESIHDEVVERLKDRLSTLRLGDPLDKNTDIGAINSAEQLARITEMAQVGEAEGAHRWQPACDLPDRGFWFPPTVFTGGPVEPDALIALARTIAPLPIRERDGDDGDDGGDR